MKRTLVVLLWAGLVLPASAQSSRQPMADLGEKNESPAPEALLPPTATLAGSHTFYALPAGTAVKMALETPVSTRRNKPGDRFRGRVAEPVKMNGRIVIPVGAVLEGRIARASEHRRIRGTPTIDLRPDTLVMPDGSRYSVNAVVVDTSSRPDVDVDDEGRLKGRGHDGRDWKETAIASGAGALTGGLIGGGEGALIGAGVGATASLVHWLVKTRSAELPSGTEITLELGRPMSLASADIGGQ